jgi:hypothetical protein
MHIEQGTGLMLDRCALALIASMLVATPALAIETQLPTAPSPQTAGTLRPPAEIPSTTGVKANAATVANKPNQHAAAQPARKKAKYANHRNSNHAMPAKSSPADITGSIPPKSVLPALY